MYKKVSVLIPTRRRLKRLETLLNSYHETTRDYEESSELVFRVDTDDIASAQFLEDYTYVVGPRFHGYDSMPLFFNELAANATGDVLMCGNDDMVFKTKSWAPLILAEAEKYPDGLFDFGVRTHNETHFPFSTVSRAAVERLGFLWDPSIFWGDIFLRDVMAAFGRTIMLQNVHIDHDWAGNTPDAVFNEADKDIVKRNPDYWQNVHTTAVTAAVQKLQELV